MSGSGSAFRSTLPLRFMGMVSSITYADGIMYLGNVLIKVRWIALTVGTHWVFDTK